MERRIGAILQEARKRREIELSEVETVTRIRLRYLRAIEAEEWDVLPGGVYTRGFIRTYASFLGLDGERLAGEYREHVEGTRAQSGPDVAPSPNGGRSRRGGPRLSASGAGWLAVAGVVLIAALAIVALPVGGDGGGGADSRNAGREATAAQESQPVEPPKPAPSGVSVRLAASAEVWVCILGGAGQHLVDGQILEAGAEEGPFHSGSFTVSFGNGEVSMIVDGKEAEIPATSSPIGYSIDASGELTELSEAERPTCL